MIGNELRDWYLRDPIIKPGTRISAAPVITTIAGQTHGMGQRVRL